MRYRSTRDHRLTATASEAILTGIAPDGGLYVPESFPKLSVESLQNLSYQEVAAEVFKLFLTDYTEQEIKCSIYKAYDEKFRKEDIVDFKHLNDYSVMELYHGKTLAFKDMALSILPHLMIKAAKRKGIKEELVILTATSGDTGKAALEGFADVPNTKVVVFYPSVGISDIQKHQMVTQKGKNTYVFGIKGNFDDAQSAVKEIFTDEKLKAGLLKEGYRFSSANSINIGRLIPQIVYYVYGYLHHVKTGVLSMGQPMNVVVPTGNFGNILAARYAKAMGLPIKQLICASNENHILTDFIREGCYDLKRSFKVTNSPSMDILISSNLERYLDLVGADVKEKMQALRTDKMYTVDRSVMQNMSDLSGYYTSESETCEEIKRIYDRFGYVVDTHTAVATHALHQYRDDTDDHAFAMVVSTASPYKFTQAVVKAIDDSRMIDDEFELIDVLHKLTDIPVPDPVKGLADLAIKHPHIISKVSIKNTVEAILR